MDHGLLGDLNGRIFSLVASVRTADWPALGTVGKAGRAPPGAGSADRPIRRG
jgi:hypothetical protein